MIPKHLGLDNAIRIKIVRFNIFESYFKGKAEYKDNEYTINIQNERRGKVVRLPFSLPNKNKLLVRLSGPGGMSVEDYLPFKGESEWIELDSTPITFYMADHQDQFDLLEIL
ncbi:Uncharacterised protein [uncultured archaeon]|nr:Uncharacterised protein [uncultured archaeon]